MLEAKVTNNGPRQVVLATLRIQLPPGLTPGPPPADCTPSGSALSCGLAVLDPGQTVARSWSVQGTVVGSHVVTAEVTSSMPDPLTANNAAEATITVREAADLGVTLTAVPADGFVGLDSVLEATVSNHGPRQVVLATLRIQLPPGLTPGSPPAGCSAAGAVLSCGFAVLDPGQTEARSWPVRGAVVGTHTVTADVTSSMPDPLTANNAAEATITVREARADLAVTLTTTAPGYVGGTGTTTVTVRNLGPQPVTDASLTVTHPPATVVALTGSAAVPRHRIAVCRPGSPGRRVDDLHGPHVLCRAPGRET